MASNLTLFKVLYYLGGILFLLGSLKAFADFGHEQPVTLGILMAAMVLQLVGGRFYHGYHR